MLSDPWIGLLLAPRLGDVLAPSRGLIPEVGGGGTI